jgi:hypothetical protein
MAVDVDVGEGSPVRRMEQLSGRGEVDQDVRLRRAAPARAAVLPSDRVVERCHPTASKGLWTHTKGGFYHDGRFRTLHEVIDHYDWTFGLGLAREAKRYLVEILKSL